MRPRSKIVANHENKAQDPRSCGQLVSLIRTHGAARTQAELQTIRAAVRKFCVRRLGRDLSLTTRSEIVERVEHSIVVAVVFERSPYLETSFWTVVKNDLLNEIDRSRRELKALAGYESVVVAPTPHSRLVDLNEAVAALAPELRHAILVYYGLGYELASIDPSTRTVARILGCSDKTARRRIRQAEQLLRARLSDLG